MRKLNKIKGPPTKFKNVSINHDMIPEERLKERQLHLKTKKLNNQIQSDDSKNRFYVLRGPIWDRKIVTRIKQKINESSNSESLVFKCRCSHN